VRLPFPDHIPLRYAFCFATLLCIAQLLQGTVALFSLCCFLFILIATFTFNLAGGFSRPSGGYVFFYAVLAVTLGLFCKALLGERADSNLTHPLLTIGATLAGITSMLAAVFVSRRLTAKRAFLGSLVTDTNMLSAATGCMIVGLFLTAIFTVVNYQPGTLLSALAQLDRFLPVAMILGVIYQIRKSGGTSSTNSLVFVSGAAIFISGVVSFSKQGMFTPMLCWLIAAASQRYRTSGFQIIGFVLAMAFMVYYLVPYSQYGRGYMINSTMASKVDVFTTNMSTAITMLSDLGHVRQEFEATTVSARNENAPEYFDTPQGLFDRLQMISMDDAIINVTEQDGPFGYGPIIYDFENIVPHFLWPGKPSIDFGNVYAHEIGMIAEENTGTGISFSPIGEAFHIGRWVGVLLLAPIIWIMLFTLFDSLCGDVRKSPWGLLALVLFAHVAPEQGLAGPIGMLWFGAIGIIMAALAAAYVMPTLGSIFTASRQPVLHRNVPIRSVPRSVPRILPSQRSGQ